MLRSGGENTGKLYDLNVWYEPKGQPCGICGKKKNHGIGIEGPGKIDVDVCDDCAGCQVMLGVDAARIARQHIAQGEKIHAKIHGLMKRKSPRHEILCRTCKDKVQERLKKRRGYEGGVTR
jgi:hypothetical protein